MHCNRTAAWLVALVAAIGGCSSSSNPSGPPTPQACTVDADCPGGQGCYETQGGADGYCSALCVADGECSGQYLCPTLEPFAEPDCRQVPDHGGKGVCQIYDRSLGPNACLAEPTK